GARDGPLACGFVMGNAVGGKERPKVHGAAYNKQPSADVGAASSREGGSVDPRYDTSPTAPSRLEAAPTSDRWTTRRKSFVARCRSDGPRCGDRRRTPRSSARSRVT